VDKAKGKDEFDFARGWTESSALAERLGKIEREAGNNERNVEV